MRVIEAPSRIIRRNVPAVLALVGLGQKGRSYPNQLSGGEQQRTALARAIVNNPPILICDEPTGNLDPETAWGIMQLLDDINKRGTTIVMATHAKDIVDAMQKRVVTLKRGHIIRDIEKVGMTMRPSTIRYFLKEGFSGLKKNLLMTVASIIAVAACISIMSFSYCVVSNLQYMLDQMEDSIGISVFLKGDLTSEDIENMKTTISGLDHVTNVTYISPADALDQLKEQWGADEDIFIGLDDTNNPLSHSFQVELDQIESQDAVLAELQKIEGVDKVEYGQSLSEMLMSVSNVFQVAGILVMLVLGVISVMIIINTIRISVMNRRVEINIMKYVGATDWFIRWPFIIEGIIIGLIGAILPMLVGMPMYGKTVSLFYNHIPFVENFVRFRVVGDVFSFVLPAALIFGILLGVVGSVTSIRKHLQV